MEIGWKDKNYNQMPYIKQVYWTSVEQDFHNR